MKLNIASGPNMFPRPWLNLDRVDQSDYLKHLREAGDVSTWPAVQQKLVADVKAELIDFETWDITRGLPYPNNCVDAIYFGQAIEHFNRGYQIPGILSECHRVLRPGAPIRITTPDLQLLLDCALAGKLDQFTYEQPEFFANALPEDRLCYLMFGAMGPDSTSDDYHGHHHLYTERSISLALVEAGFSVITFEKESQREEFADVVDCGMSHSLAVEAIK